MEFYKDYFNLSDKYKLGLRDNWPTSGTFVAEIEGTLVNDDSKSTISSILRACA